MTVDYYIKEIIFILILIIFIFVLFTIINLIGELTRYFAWKREKMQHPYIPINDKIDYTNDLMSLLSDIIDIEITNSLQKYLYLDNKYPLKNLDEDIKTISSNVFSYCIEDVFTNEDQFIVTPAYLMTYITNTVKMRLISYSKEINDTKINMI